MAVSPIKLPRLMQGWRTQPQLFERYWDNAMTKLEETLNAIISIPEIEAALVDLDAATAAAQAAADAANAAADATTSESSIVNSYPSNFVAPLVSITSGGVVTVANHDRVYGDSTMNPTVSVVGGSFGTGATAGQVVRVYYVDPTRAGGAVTYQFTIDPASPPVQGGDTHSVGAVTVPGAGSNNGNPVRPPGYAEP